MGSKAHVLVTVLIKFCLPLPVHLVLGVLSGVSRCVGKEVFLHVGILVSYYRNPFILFIQIITGNGKGLRAGAWYIWVS